MDRWCETCRALTWHRQTGGGHLRCTRCNTMPTMRAGWLVALLLCLSAPAWAASTPRDRGKDLRPLKTCAPGQKLIGGKCVTTCERAVQRG